MAITLANYYEQYADGNTTGLYSQPGGPTIPNPNDPNNNSTAQYGGVTFGGFNNNGTNPAPLITVPVTQGAIGNSGEGLLSSLSGGGLSSIPGVGGLGGGLLNIVDGATGGIVEELAAGALDAARITKFLATPQGIAFNLKQVWLQAMNTKVPYSGLNNDTRIYNLGINTLLQVPLEAIDIHIERHGLFPSFQEYPNNKGVYSQYFNNPLRGTRTEAGEGERTFDNSLYNLKVSSFDSEEVGIGGDWFHYGGGPKSKFGIGRTSHKRWVDSQDITEGVKDSSFRSTTSDLFDLISLNSIRDNIISQPISKALSDKSNGMFDVGFFDNQYNISTNFRPLSRGNTGPSRDMDEADQWGSTLSAMEFGGVESSDLNTPNKNYFKARPNKRGVPLVVAKPKGFSLNEDIQGLIDNFRKGISTVSNNTGNTDLTKDQEFPFTRQKDSIDDITLVKGPSLKNNRSFKSNLDKYSNPYKSFDDVSSLLMDAKDMIDFRFEAIDNDKPSESVFMLFRSYLSSITDSYSPTWNPHKYLGRGEKVYTYSGFDRSFSFNFKMAPMSRVSVKPLIQKLNFLASNTAPDYNTAGRMRGPFMRLTIGDYVVGLPGFISSLTYSIDDNAPWDTALYGDKTDIIDNDITKKWVENERQLPHLINVSVTYTPIHDFLPRKVDKDNTSSSPFILRKDDPWYKKEIFNMDPDDPEDPTEIVEPLAINDNYDYSPAGINTSGMRSELQPINQVSLPPGANQIPFPMRVNNGITPGGTVDATMNGVYPPEGSTRGMSSTPPGNSITTISTIGQPDERMMQQLNDANSLILNP
jgi:hypothetical protein